MNITGYSASVSPDFTASITSYSKPGFLRILATESYANLRYILPACVKWAWQKYVKNEIHTLAFDVTVGNVTKVAYLNIHGTLPERQEMKVFPVILSHGDFSHPFTMLHLADLAKKKGLPTFSIYIPGVHNNENHALHNAVLEKSIEKIQGIIQPLGVFGGALCAGHSKGAIMLAEQQFVNLDTRIKAVCAIGGRLNIPDDQDVEDPFLIPIVKGIYQGIMSHPELPIMQIVAEEDWNASRESMMVRPHDHGYIVPGMHLSGLFVNETRHHFSAFLDEFKN